jgi:hypothetical protein
LIEFRRYLIQKKIDADNRRQKILHERKRRNQNNNIISINNNYYEWIEQLLQTPIEDYRKIIVDLILAPYLISIRKLSFEESYTSIKNWLDKCNALQKLDNYRNFEFRINYALRTANKKQIPPMSYITLKENNKDLYSLIIQNKKEL